MIKCLPGFLSLWVLLGCADDAYIELPFTEAPKVVITSHFTADEPLTVYLSVSRPITAQEIPALSSNAEVTLAAEGNLPDRLLPYLTLDSGIAWKSQNVLKKGVRYTLTVRVPGMETAWASDTIPEGVSDVYLLVRESNIRFTPEPAEGKWIARIPISILLKDLPHERRYFAFCIRHKLYKGQGSSEVRASRFLASGRVLALSETTPEGLTLIKESYWSEGGKDHGKLDLEVIIPYDPARERPDSLFLEWRTLSEAYYRYHLSLATQGSPFNDPDALYNNVRGGYGNFSGFARLRKAVSIPR
ncbi:MAG: DUF4249 domain-containing protein [Saprospiraceae bacterium]|nr:DUF4249 domain-containing protein [Saprospiraceae bacterium]MDW8485125.1 DUF4249 domain-containing protein [Saprospiraceae bacterium]